MAICVWLRCKLKYSQSRIIGHGPCTKKYGQINHMPLKKWAELCAGIYTGVESVIVLTENGHLFTWGNNGEAQLGLGQDCTSAPVPTRLHLPNDELVIEVACGGWHTLALTDSGKVYSWGSNSAGQVSQLLPEKVWTPLNALNEDGLGRSKIMAIACGEKSSLVLRSNGQVWAWGKNFLTALGSTIVKPTMIPLDFEVTKVHFGS